MSAEIRGTAIFDIIGTCFTLDRPRQALIGLGGLPTLLDTWFAQSLRDYVAFSHAGGYAPLKDVLEAELPRTLAQAGIAHTAEDLRTVVRSFAELDPRPDFAGAVEHLHSHGWRLVALTNGSQSSTAVLLERAGVETRFADVISCDSIQVSKPNPAAYRLVTEMVGSEDEVWMLAAHAWDIAGAARAGLRTVFITSVEGSYLDVYGQPDFTVAGLLAAARVLAH